MGRLYLKKSKRKVVLAGMILPENEADFEEIMQECIDLCEACHMEVVSTMTQRLDHPDPRSGFQSGKLAELKVLSEELEVQAIVFVNNLSITVAKRIQEECGLVVMDRTSLILEIFALRARTKKAQLQVELARLQYDLPRLTLDVEKESHLRGGGYRNRGAGEMRSTRIRSLYKKRMKDLEKQLASMEQEESYAQKRRNKSKLAKAALVGYTNAGKSSLMNEMLVYNNRSDANVFEKDMLFATLDTSIRHMSFEKYEFLLYDTVGFVSDLPQSLLDAFYSTLDAARQADLLIHVIDISNKDWEKKALITEETLKQIGAGDIPVVRVFNKADLLEKEPAFPGLYTSCFKHTGIEELLDEITKRLYPIEETMTVMLPYDKMSMIEENCKTLSIEILENTQEGIKLQVSGEIQRMIPFLKYEMKEDEYGNKDSLGKV